MKFNNFLEISPGGEVVVPWVIAGVLAVICAVLSALLIKMRSYGKASEASREDDVTAVMPESAATTEHPELPAEQDVYSLVGEMYDKVNSAIETLNNARGGVSVAYLEQEIGVAIDKLKSIWEE